MHVNTFSTVAVYKAVFLQMKHRSSKHVEEITKLKIKIFIQKNVHFIGLCCIITLHYNAWCKQIYFFKLQ